ncbi:MAG: hypothetical protein NVS1B6_05010 [Steroidobacteraceae bacterium]
MKGSPNGFPYGADRWMQRADTPKLEAIRSDVDGGHLKESPDLPGNRVELVPGKNPARPMLEDT